MALSNDLTYPDTQSGEYVSCQLRFQQRWPHLTDPHVRSLAWLLDAPDLLHAGHQRWSGRLAHLPVMCPAVADWLTGLDHRPQALLTFLALHPHTRLGHYAENLMAFYFAWRGELVAQGVQVRAQTTIGEFDFLLQSDAGLQHWEFACKFYLLAPQLAGTARKMVSSFSLPPPADQLMDYVGPNLSDNLGDKIHKILELQLALGQHPAAQPYLPAPLLAARAWLKGWLFYPVHCPSPDNSFDTLVPDSISPQHCRGLWCRVAELPDVCGSLSRKAGGAGDTDFSSDYFHILSRLNWLAPAKVHPSEVQNGLSLQAYLHRYFLTDNRPVLVAQCKEAGAFLVEQQRIFVVPDDWGSNDGAYSRKN